MNEEACQILKLVPSLCVEDRWAAESDGVGD